jgi:peptidyl-prolyl cis-trans isomerase A (cyclophilin A)
MPNARLLAALGVLSLGLSPLTPALAAATAKAAPSLLAPDKATAEAPAVYKVKFVTTKGDFVLEVHRDWSPKGADRFFNLVKLGFFDDTSFFRVIPGFMVQFGLSGKPEVNARWREARITDDPHSQSNDRGMVSFATGGPNTRTSQVFINFVSNARLDGMGFTPFAKVLTGMDVVDKLYSGYGEGAPGGRGPSQELIQKQGGDYLKKQFPLLDYVKTAKVVK